jgi:hypothetical protein
MFELFFVKRNKFQQIVHYLEQIKAQKKYSSIVFVLKLFSSPVRNSIRRCAPGKIEPINEWLPSRSEWLW